MSDIGNLGKTLVIVGAAISALGVLFILSKSVPWLRIGRLPGDVVIEKDGFTFYFPIVTMILISVIATIVFYIISALRK
jgi:hypothetical protein